jgi:AhpD family alkylhydroperoxidase
MSKIVNDYNDYRQRMNEKILAAEDKTIKRIFNADTNAYLAGALDVKTKEIMGLVASMVLRCDDCVRYHILRCHENGLSTEELFEVFGIANLVGGTIVIPHTRRALEFWEEIQISGNKG